MSDPSFSKRCDAISPFTVMQLLQRAGELEADGHKVVHFEVGEPDFSTSQPVLDAAHNALREGRTKYTAAQGIPELRAAISDYYAKAGVDVPADRILVTSGASGGLTLLSALLLNPGEEMLITDPGYPCNEVFTRLVGGIPKPIVVGAEQRFQPTVTDVRDAWGSNTRGMLLASPSNPTGTMLAAKQLQELNAEVRRRSGFFILDEIYQNLVQTPWQYSTGLSACPDLFVLNSFSKYFGMTGWRLGWIVVPDRAIDAVTKLAQNLFISPSAPAQYAAIAAFSDAAMKINQQRVEIFAERSRQLSAGLASLGLNIPVMPDGAFYLYADISHLGMPSSEFCWRLLNEYQIAVTPGTDFGTANAYNYVRFAFTTGQADIALGLDRLAAALQAWR